MDLMVLAGCCVGIRSFHSGSCRTNETLFRSLATYVIGSNETVPIADSIPLREESQSWKVKGSKNRCEIKLENPLI